MEKLNRTSFSLGFFLCFSMMGCAGAFTYKYYGMQLADYTNGKLLGPEAKDDLDMRVCEPTASDKGPCVVMLREAFFELKRDYEAKDEALIACQQGH